MRPTVLLLFAIAGCGGLSAEQPLTIPLGIPRDQADAALKRHRYCHTVDGPRAEIETYPRCSRPGTEWGDSWVEAHYDDNRLVELRRYERYDDDKRAKERWNQLVGARTQQTPASAEAAQALRGQLLEPGTRSVQAFRIDPETVVGIYLLEPQPPGNANVLEAVILAPAK